MRGHSICYMHCESTVKIKGYLAKKSVFLVKGDVDVLQHGSVPLFCD